MGAELTQVGNLTTTPNEPNMNAPKMQRVRAYLKSVALLPGILILGTPYAVAQEAAQNDEEADAEIITLNPFTVTEETDTWNATETLAGSRLKTDLADVASQVEVMTMDFMDAFTVNSIEEAAIYAMNAESPQETTGGGISGQGTENIRIRGISSGTRSREFFRSGISTDNYNLTRVSISSGPNAILFGTGSAAGSIDSTIARAELHEEKGDVEVQVDSNGTFRGEFDYNMPIVEDRLALRIAGLKYDRRFDQDKAFIDTNRFYATAMFKPWKGASLSLHTEQIDIENRRPERTVPFDNITTWTNSADLLQQSGLVDANNPIIPNQTAFDNGPAWIAAGRPLNRNQAAISSTNGNAIMLLGGSTDARSWWGGVNYDDVEVNGDLNIYETVNRSSNGTTLLNDEFFPLDLHTTRNFRARNTDAVINNVFFNQEIFKGLFLDVGYHFEENEYFNFEGPGFIEGYNIQVDANQYLPGEGNGSVANPYYGQFYVDGNGNYTRGTATTEELRGALSYEFDVRDWTDNKFLGWLGRHRLAGMVMERDEENLNQRYEYHMMPQMIDGKFQDGSFKGFPYNPNDDRPAIAGLGVPGAGGNQSGDFRIDARNINFRSYFGGPGNVRIPELPSGFAFGQPYTLTDNNGLAFNIDPENAARGTNGERLISGRSPDGTISFLDTKQWAWQGYLWNDRIIATYGWREDKLNTAQEDLSHLSTTWTHPETGVVSPINNVRLRDHMDQALWEDYDPAEESTGETTLQGIVVAPFRNWDKFELPFGADLSFSYSKSDTFQPNTTERNPNGTFIQGEEGEGEDWGARLSLFDGAFTMRWNHYETIAGPTKLFLPFRRWRFRWRNGGAMRDVVAMLSGADQNIFNQYFPNPEDWPLRATDPNYDAENAYPFGVRDGGFATQDFDNYADPYTFTADSLAEGDEFSVAWKPTRNLTLRATFNEQEVIQSNLGSSWFQFTDEYIAIMDRTQFVEGYVPGIVGLSGHDNPAGTDLDGMDINPNDGLAPGIDYFSWDQIPYGGNGNGRNLIQGGAWGQNAASVPGGWTRPTMRDRFFQQVINSNNGTAVMKAFDGRPNTFLRDNRVNVNAQYRFSEGRLKGWRVGGAYRWRAGAGIGLGTQVINGAEVPDTDIILIGKDTSFVDLSFEWRGKSNIFGFLKEEKNVHFGVTVRNLFDEGPYETELVDATTLSPTNLLRVDGRVFVFKSGLEF
ncbi:MAG: hypothetical protein SynsKO_34040 [Synoicihabitans sp.]